MASNKIFALVKGKEDPTRWLTLSLRHPGTCLLDLSDLCLPGLMSNIGEVPCPSDFLRTAVTLGPLQLTLENAYLLIRREPDYVHFEFKHKADTSTVKADFSYQAFYDALRALEAPNVPASLK